MLRVRLSSKMQRLPMKSEMKQVLAGILFSSVSYVNSVSNGPNV